MKLLRQVIYLTINFQLIFCHTFYNESLIVYWSKEIGTTLNECPIFSQHSCLFLTNLHNNFEIKVIENEFIKLFTNCTSVVTTNILKFESDSISPFEQIVMFVSHLDSLTKNLKDMTNSRTWWTNTKFYFLLNQKMNYVHSEILQLIWNNKIIHFLLIILENKPKIYTYNHFSKKKIIMVPQKDLCTQIIQDKLKNFHLEPIRAAIMEIYPLIYKENDTWKGEAITIFELWTEHLNASKAFVQTYTHNESVETLIKNETDIFMLRSFNLFVSTYVSVTLFGLD